jgi:predicted YcjX-like family ATPase
MPRFRPPPIDLAGRNGLPHLGLDAVLDDLLGDLL